jgi:hypothetical protein
MYYVPVHFKIDGLEKYFSVDVFVREGKVWTIDIYHSLKNYLTFEPRLTFEIAEDLYFYPDWLLDQIFTVSI